MQEHGGIAEIIATKQFPGIKSATNTAAQKLPGFNRSDDSYFSVALGQRVPAGGVKREQFLKKRGLINPGNDFRSGEDLIREGERVAERNRTEKMEKSLSSFGRYLKEAKDTIAPGKSWKQIIKEHCKAVGGKKGVDLPGGFEPDKVRVRRKIRVPKER